MARRWRASALILVYHRVCDDPVDTTGLSVSPARFAEHLEVLRRHFEPLPLSAIIHAQPRWRRPAVAVTFDDGYADNLLVARPLLERYEIPATVFVTTGQLGGERAFWWDRLEECIVHSRPLPARLPNAFDARGGDGVEFCDAENSDSRRKLFWRLHEQLATEGPDARSELLAQLSEWSSTPSGPPRHRTLTRDELVSLDEGGLVAIGAHSVSHPILAGLSSEAQRAEINGCRAQLEQLLGRAPEAFAYPYGETATFSAETVEFVRQAGFSMAFTGERGALLPRADPHRLPRCSVRNWDGDKLARRLARWSRR